MKASNLIKRLEKLNDEIGQIGDELVKSFPQSSSLYKFATELNSAQSGMHALVEEFKKAMTTAESEETIRKDLTEQIGNNEVYAFLDPDQKKRLIEYLVQQGAPLASEEDLLGFVVKSLKNLEPDQVAKNLSKDFIMRLGGKSGESEEKAGGEFDAYGAGVQKLQEIMEDPEERDKFIGVMAKEYLKREPELTVRRFYSKVSL